MVKKEFTYRGKTTRELQSMSHEELARLLPSRQRRNLKKGFTAQQKRLMARLERENDVETHCRDMLILPSMFNKTIRIHNGKEFIPVIISEEMIGHFLGEFAITRRKVAHNAPGIGATRSSASVSVR